MCRAEAMEPAARCSRCPGCHNRSDGCWLGKISKTLDTLNVQGDGVPILPADVRANVASVRPRTADDHWCLNDIARVFVTDKIHAASVGRFVQCFPGASSLRRFPPAGKGRNSQRHRAGKLETVVLFIFFHLRNYGTHVERNNVAAAVLESLGQDLSILTEFETKTERFENLRAWSYDPARVQSVPAEEESDDGGARHSESEGESDAESEGGSGSDRDGAESPERGDLEEYQAVSAMEGSPHLYVARCSCEIYKVGISAQPAKRMRKLTATWGRKHTLRAFWRHAGHLEQAVLRALRDRKHPVLSENGQASREHVKCSFEEICEAIALADQRHCPGERPLRKRARVEAELECDLAWLDMRRSRYLSLAQHTHADAELLRELVRERRPEAIATFLSLVSGT